MERFERSRPAHEIALDARAMITRATAMKAIARLQNATNFRAYQFGMFELRNYYRSTNLRRKEVPFSGTKLALESQC